MCLPLHSFDAFQNSTDAQRTFREVMFLQQMKGHEHIITLLNVLKADNDRDIYLTFEYMETDLHAAIRANILQDIHKQYILWQSLKALKFMHSAKLLHRDMKPSNLLLNSDCLMKVADFGLARSLVPAGQNMGQASRGKESINAAGFYSLCHSNGQWEFYPPDQSAAIEEAFAASPGGGSLRLPHAGSGGASKSSQEVRWGSQATSSKMPAAPATGLIQVHSTSSETRVVRRNVGLYSFQHLSTGLYEVYPPDQCAAIEEAIGASPQGGAVRLPVPGGGHGLKSNYEVRWGHEAANAGGKAEGGRAPLLQVHVTSGDTRHVRRNEFSLSEAPIAASRKANGRGDGDEAYIEAGEADAPAHLTDYVATRWYRAPEILLGSQEYSFGVDMWALGCILGEMINGKPVFPGSSTLNQLERIMELTGVSDQLRGLSKFAPHLVEQVKTTLRHDDPALEERWDSTFKSVSPDAKSLLKALLALHPKERITAEDALKHAYVAQFHMPNVERTAAHHVHVPIDDCEKRSTAAYRNMLYEEVTRMKRQNEGASASHRYERGGSSQRQ